MSEIEKWLPVTGAMTYAVSSHGRVMSLRGKRPYEMTGAVVQGYRRVALRTDQGERKSLAVHRLVALAFIGPCPEGQEVRHLDGNSQNNDLSNLAFGTRSENSQDSIEHGTHPQASKTHCIHGHEFTPENTRLYHGVRLCRACHRVRSREYEIRKQFAAANVSERAA